MVIWPAFRMEKYRVNDHPYHAPHFMSHTCLQLVLDVVQVQPFVDIVILALVVYMVGVGVVVDY